MIRAVALVLAVLTGIAGAFILQGRMYHARLALPDMLPAWSSQIANNAGVVAGALKLSGRPGVSSGEIAWTALMPGLDGLRWMLRMTGPGIDLRARMTLQFNLDRAEIDHAKGTIDLAGLGPTIRDLEGIVELTGLSIALDDIRFALRASGSAEAKWQGAHFQGVDLGSGPVRAELDPLQSWRAQFDLTGGVAKVQGTLSGRMPRPVISLNAKISDDPTLPDTWRRGLAIAGKKTEGVWLLRQKVNLSAPGG